MSLILKKEKRPNLSNLKVFVEDESLFSPNYFKVSDVPQILQKGKNLLRIKGNSNNLVEGSQILIDVRDSNGNEIFFEVPDFIEDDKGRIISIFIYHDKGDDNTPNGDATITIVGTAKFDLNGNPIPKQFQNIPNVRWSETINVDRNRGNTSPIIFNTTTLPTVTVSETIETYTDIAQGGGLPTKTTTNGAGVNYILRGSTPIVQKSTGSPFNQEMVGGTLFLHSFTNPPTPSTLIQNPTNITSYTSSIVQVLDSQTVRLATPFTTTFDNRVGLTHTFSDISAARFRVEFFSTGSNTTSNSKRAFANITVSGSDPMVGVVDKIKVLIKSDGLDGDDELLNEVSVPFSSSYLLKIPVPSEHLRDVQKLKIQYLNSIGNISRTETVSDAIAFQGNKDRVEGTLGGFAITATAISSSFNLQDGTPALLLGRQGDITGSSIFIRQIYEGNTYSLIDTTVGLFDGQNIGRQIVSDAEEYIRSNVDDDAVFNIRNQYPVTFLPGETHIGISFQAKTIFGQSAPSIGVGTIRFEIATPVRSGSSVSYGTDVYDSYNSVAVTKDYTISVSSILSQNSGSLSIGSGNPTSIVELPESVQGKYANIIISMNHNVTAGSNSGTSTRFKNISIYAGRLFAANNASNTISGSLAPAALELSAGG